MLQKAKESSEHLQEENAQLRSSSPAAMEEEEAMFMSAMSRRTRRRFESEDTMGLEAYIRSPPAARSPKTTLTYWKRLQMSDVKFRHFSTLARDILSLPASWTNVERVFSQVGNTTDPLRANLLPENLISHAASKILLMQGFGKM